MRRALVPLLALAVAGCGVDLQAASPVATPPPITGELTVAGEREGSLSANAVTRFAAAQDAVHARYDGVGATAGFARLCRGAVDIVDSARPISKAERDACRRNGIALRAPIQIASDAIVLATRNEFDVGGDCLTVSAVRDVFRRGSTVSSWSGLGFRDLPLRAVGPAEDANPLPFFASEVLGVTRAATLADLRADYVPLAGDDAIRRAIVRKRRGVVGFVRFSYYEAFEDELRPLEIDAGKSGRPDCVFPSQETITSGDYPLSRQILLYTSADGLRRPEVRAFLAYTLRRAQRLATSLRLVPITDRLQAEQYALVNGRGTTTEGAQ